MKKIYVVLCIVYCFTLLGSSVLEISLRSKTNLEKSVIAIESGIVYGENTGEKETIHEEIQEYNGQTVSSDENAVQQGYDNEEVLTKSNQESNSKASVALSRGGVPPVKSSAVEDTKSGELVDWWKSAQYILPNDSVGQVMDLYTGKTFYIKRTFGTNHADVEALSLEDTNIIKSIWGGFSWERRPIIISIEGRKLAASMTAMPHAGVDSQPALATVKNRSDNYGTGTNLDKIKDNGMDGVMDIHFLNSTRHKDNKKDPQHQAAILKAAGK